MDEIWIRISDKLARRATGKIGCDEDEWEVKGLEEGRIDPNSF